MSIPVGSRDVPAMKSVLREVRSRLPPWRDVHKSGWPSPAELTAQLRGTIFLEYDVETDGSRQGQAVCVFSKRLRLPTRPGVYFSGVHLAASDRSYHQYMQRGKKDMGEVHYFHVVLDSSDATLVQAELRGQLGTCVHILRYRILSREQVVEVAYARECAEQYLDALDEVAGAGGADGAAPAEPPEKRTRVSFKSPEAEAAVDPAWDAALGPRFGAAPASDVDEDLAKRLAEADANARKAARAHGVAPAAKAKAGANVPRTPRGAGVGLESELNAALGEPSGDEVDDVDESPASASSKKSPGVAMQAELLRAAQRRAKAASSKKSEVQSRHGRLVETLAKLLSSGASGDAEAGDDGADAPLGDSEPEGALSLFRGAPSSLSGPETTSSFAARRPGELLAGGVKRVRGILSAIHGEEATKNEGQRLFSFYFRVYLRPRLGDVGPHSDREMTTLVEALDSLLEGNTARTGDILVTRLKALEEAARSGNWTMAQQFEAVPQDDFGLITDAERQHAATLQLRAARLRETTSQGSDGRRGR